MTGIDVFCGSCGNTATVNKVTAGLQCRCGDNELGVVGIDPLPERLAYPQGPGTGWGKPMPDPAANWSDYAGPGVGPNPQTTPPVSDNMVCPTCHGAGYDIQDKAICRECGGTGRYTPPTSQPAVEQYDAHAGPASGGARWAASRTAAGSRRFFSKHPSGYRAEWHGGPRFHVYEGDVPVDSPTINGYDHSMRSADVDKLTSGFTQKKLDNHLHGWVKEHGEDYSRFNHPDIEPTSYQDRARMRDLDAEGSRQIRAGRPSTVDPYGTAEYQNRHGGGDYADRRGNPGEFSWDDLSTHYPKAPGRSPATRVREDRDYSQPPDRPYQLNEAPCPECGHAPTQLLKTAPDAKGRADGVWHCPQCGPLVNIDKHPQIDPYHPHETGYVGPDRKAFKTSRLAGLGQVQRSGKLLSLIATVQEHNVVSVRESLELARNTLITYPEGRS